MPRTDGLIPTPKRLAAVLVSQLRTTGMFTSAQLETIARTSETLFDYRAGRDGRALTSEDHDWFTDELDCLRRSCDGVEAGVGVVIEVTALRRFVSIITTLVGHQDSPQQVVANG